MPKLTLTAITTLTALLVGAATAQTTITYTYPGPVPKDTALVSEALSKLTLDKIGVRVKLEPVDWGAYDQKRSLALSAGEKCDVMFTAPWINNFGRNVSQGNLLALDDLLQKSAPKLFSSVKPAIWDAARVEGKIYSVINQQAFPKTWGFLLSTEFAEKYKLDLTKVRRYEDLEPLLAAIKKNEKGVTPLYADASGNNTLYHAEQLGWDLVGPEGAVVKYNDKSLKVLNAYATPEFKRLVNLARKWNLAGYFPTDLPSQADGDAGFKAGKYVVKIDQWRPDSRSQAQGRFGLEVIGKSLTRPILTTGALTATMNGVCKTSSNAAASVKFLELLNTDVAVYNLVSKGIEGKHYVFTNAAKKIIGQPPGMTVETNPYNPGTDWMFGSVFNAFPSSEAQIKENADSVGINRQSVASQALGFNFDPEPVKSEVAQLGAIFKEYGSPLINGQVDPARALPDFQNRLKAAGIDKVIAETQKQLNAWSKTRK
jgi:putative aldouronate transport system substrate-binding protein